MKFGYIDESKRLEWEALVDQNSAGGYMQSFFWTEFINTLGWKTYKIGIFEKDKLVGGAIVGKYDHFKDRNFLVIPDGPILPYSAKKAKEMFEKLMTEIDSIVDLKGKKLSSHLHIEPRLSTVPDFIKRFKKSLRDIQPVKTLIVDLTKSEEEILRGMKPKGRYNIKIAQKYGIDITFDSPQNGIKKFLKLYRTFAKGKNMEVKRDDYFYALSEILEKYQCGRIYFAGYKKAVLATSLIIYFGSSVVYLYGASSKKYKKVMAPYLLHWQIIKDTKEMGFKMYDFYGLSPDDRDEKHPWTGFSIFKKKFGGKEIATTGGYDFIYNKVLYKKYLAAE